MDPIYTNNDDDGEGGKVGNGWMVCASCTMGGGSIKEMGRRAVSHHHHDPAAATIHVGSSNDDEVPTL